MKVLVTGGCGYIGSHTSVALLQAGFAVVLFDNLSNSTSAVLGPIARLGGPKVTLVQGDVRQPDDLAQVFADHRFDAVIHFAGLKAVSESVQVPLNYYEHNVSGTLQLLRAMDVAGVRRLVFSSSATVYAEDAACPLNESAALDATNPYGRSKLMCEQLLCDVQAADPRWQVAVLRYFNPVGAHPSGEMGELPIGVPQNLMPMITQATKGLRPHLSIFGDDYPTPDGTAVRDYIHVQDLAAGHVAALAYMAHQDKGLTVNLGTGRGVSVKEMIDTFERVNAVQVPYRWAARRAGDVAVRFADVGLAQQLMGWRAQLSLDEMCRDAWRWQTTGAGAP
ncbi:MAG: UDP-glucose 4-epimerase GalE [Alphaproteobacteria bacterium]|nr:UDP-glucose 4-epimerase GalE [Alphaproteobacteria bacterium]